MMGRLFVLLQFVLPQHLMTRLVWRLARVRNPAIKDFLITKFVSVFDVNVDEVMQDVPFGYATFNDFFIRELSDGARPIDQDPSRIASPVDGTVSIADSIRDDTIIQAKGIDYSLGDLIATDVEQAEAFRDGRFATVYLAPYNYHRVHSPFDGKLVAARYVPGDLFSVNQSTVALVNGLFRRNERLVMHFDTQFGRAALIFVGALNVGSISTPWTGEIRPRKSGVVEALDVSRYSTAIKKGDLLGWFNMGSTVILLLPEGTAEWSPTLRTGAVLRVGETIGRISAIDK